ncbi:MAG: hypothetical protein KAX49_13045 [Halanaerobiales bacterium]|nr:hypothetical protein [Halanaerobiales bacterium]
MSDKFREGIVNLGNFLIATKEIKDILPKIQDWEGFLNLNNIGNRGNFIIVNKKNGKIIRFNNGKRIK